MVKIQGTAGDASGERHSLCLQPWWLLAGALVVVVGRVDTVTGARGVGDAGNLCKFLR
jgi:hypothetical protein